MNVSKLATTHSAPYAFAGRLNTGLVRLAHPRYGAQLWTIGKIRKRAKDCADCCSPIPAGTLAFRPITNGYNRMERLCPGCILVLVFEASKRPAAPQAEPTEGRCFHCEKPCSADDYCSGCKAFICSDCEDGFPMGFDHCPEEHLHEEDR